jgi:hypothetical protein
MGSIVLFPEQPQMPPGKQISLDILCTSCDGFIVVDIDLTTALAAHDADALDLAVGRNVNAALISHHMLECPARAT